MLQVSASDVLIQIVFALRQCKSTHIMENNCRALLVDAACEAVNLSKLNTLHLQFYLITQTKSQIA